MRDGRAGRAVGDRNPSGGPGMTLSSGRRGMTVAEQAGGQGLGEPVLVALGGPVSLADQGAVQVVAGQGPDDVCRFVDSEVVSQNAPLLQVGRQASLGCAAPRLGPA